MTTYWCLHIPTGKQIERKWIEHGEGWEYMSYHQKLIKLNEWNSQQAGIWQYWM